MAAGHPQAHLWAALQRRFTDQTKPSTSPDRLLRGLCIAPLDGQEEAAVWSLGFREVGSVLRLDTDPSSDVEVTLGGLTKFYGTPTAHQGNVAIKINDVVTKEGAS